MKMFESLFVLGLITLLANCSETNTTERHEELNTTAVSKDTISEASEMIDSPSGLVLGEFFASDNNQYDFCPDGSIYFDNHANTQLDGKWEIKNDTIYLTYTRKITQEGIGESLELPDAVPGNYVTQYEEYKEKIEKVFIEEYLIWSEIKTFLDQDSSYPYQIVQRGIRCD